jgi:hypothetical protein
MPSDNRSQTIGFRATEDERKLFEKQALVLKLRLSEYIRLCVLNDIAMRQEKS